MLLKVERKAKIRNQYNQVPYLTQNTVWETVKNTRKYNTYESEEVSPFLAGDHKAAINRHDIITNIYMFNGINLTPSSDVDQDT